MVPVLDVWSRFLLDMEAEHYSPEKDIKKKQAFAKSPFS